MTDGALALARIDVRRAALPPESPIPMPTQSLRRWSASNARPRLAPALWRTPVFARLFVFVGAILVTAAGVWDMMRVVSVAGTTVLEFVLLGLFALNFSWIALAFTSGTLGFLVLLMRPKAKPGPLPPLRQRTALLMPIYNEAPSRIFASLQAIWESLEATGEARAFDLFILSDTTDPDVWVAEERAYLAFRERIGETSGIYYRHRPKNLSRKAGNIADWVTRWGGAYAHMLVLDADSLMTGDTIVRLTAAMEGDPDAGIIQTLPLIINRNTLFARLQQFAARVYGPVIATGLSAWMARDGNYWGHNAIIRTRAFADHAGLPDLPGRPPFGGHILSHDFVEAALIRRAGWAVYMLPDLGGSYEESPPSLIDLTQRDRRWAQGNLQHSRVFMARGFHPATRQHFITGIMSYLASPLWLMQLVVGIALSLQAHYIRPEYFTDEFSLYPAWPSFDAERALALFGATMGILLAPKAYGLIIVLLNGEDRRASGGWLRLIVSTLIEVIVSALIAPILMLVQSQSVSQILLGRDSGWKPQRRDDGSIPFRDIVRRHRGHVALGVVAALSAYLISPYLLAWMSPTLLGLTLAVPLSWASGQLSIGLALKRHGLLVTPEEAQEPPIARRANALMHDLAASGADDGEALHVINRDPNLRDEHLAMLPAHHRRERGTFDSERIIAQAKIDEAQTVDEVVRWMSPRERFVALHDPALVAKIARLADGR